MQCGPPGKNGLLRPLCLRAACDCYVEGVHAKGVCGPVPPGLGPQPKIARVRRGLAQIETELAILIAHSGTIRAALAIALELKPEISLRFVVDPLSVTRIDRLQNGWRVVSVNQNFR